MYTSNKSLEHSQNYCEIYISKKLQPTPLHLEALQKLMEGHTLAVKLEKLHDKADIYSIRASKSARIVGVFANQSNKRRFFVFALYDKHEYKKLKLLNLADIKYPVIELDSDSEVAFKPKNDWRATHYIDKQLICFSEQQETILHTVSLPLIVTGPAGAGKTLIIIKLLDDLLSNLPESAQDKRYLYIASTDQLAKEAQRIFGDLHLGPNANKVTFMGLEQFIQDNKPNKSTVTTREDLKNWLINTKFHKRFNTLIKKIDILIEEFKTTAMLTKKEYVSLGKTQSLLSSEEEKNLCYDLYTQYKTQNPNSCQFLFPNLKEDKPCFEMIFIDEGQNYTIKQLLALIECAKDGQFMIFGDPLQNFTNKISVFPKLKEIIKLKYNQKEPLKILVDGHRNPDPVIDFLNDLLFVRRLLSDGVDDECEAIQVKPARTDTKSHAPVQWINTLTKTNIQQFSAMFSMPDTMIIAFSGKQLKEIEDLVGRDPVVVFPEYVQGLQAKKVLVYYPLSTELIKKINTHLSRIDLSKNPINSPGSKSLGTSEFTMDLNKLILAITRVAQEGGELILYLGEHPPRHSELFFSLLKKSLQKQFFELTVDPEQSPPSEPKSWDKWIKDLYKNGQKEKAKVLYAKHINKDLSGFNAFVGAPKESIQSTKTITTQKTQQPLENTTTSSSTNSCQPASASTLKFDAADLYIHKLLKSLNIETLAKFLSHEKAKEYLLHHYRPENGGPKEALLKTLFSEANYLQVLIDTFNKKPFSTLVIVFCKEQTIEIIQSLLQKKQCDKRLFEFLNTLICQHPNFIGTLSIGFVRLLMIESLLCFDFDLIETLSRIKPELLIQLIQDNTKNKLKLNDLWCIQLLKNRTGCGILCHLYQQYPPLLSHFSSEAIRSEMMRIDLSETPLFFWLCTAVDGKNLFKAMMSQWPDLKQAITPDMLLCKVSVEGSRFDKTSMVFWMLTGERKYQTLSALTENHTELLGLNDLIAKEEYAHPDFPGNSLWGKDLLHLSQGDEKVYERFLSGEFIPMVIPDKFSSYTTSKVFKFENPEFMLVMSNNASLEELESALITILEHEDAQTLLFDFHYTQNTNLFMTLIDNKDYYPIFVNLLEKNPSFSQLFTPVRLNQSVFSKGGISSVFLQMLGRAQELLGVLLKTNPDLPHLIHEQGLLYSPIFIEDGIVHSFVYLYIAKDLSFLAPLIQKEQLTPQFFYNLSFCNSFAKISLLERLMVSNIELLYSWLESEPNLALYLKASHLIPNSLEGLLDFYPELKMKDKCILHVLLTSDIGFKFLLKVLEKAANLLPQLTLSVLTYPTHSDNSPLFYLSLSEERCHLLLRLLTSNTATPLAIKPEHLDELDLKDETKSILSNLIKCQKGIQVLHTLMSHASFTKAMNPEKLLPITSKSTLLYNELCLSEEGKQVLNLLLNVHPDWMNKLTQAQKAQQNQAKGMTNSNQTPFNLSEYLKKALSLFGPQIAENILKNKKCDYYLFTPTSIRDEKPETLFELILENEHFVEAFCSVLKKDNFIGTDALIKKNIPITKIIEKILSGQSTIHCIKLFAILIANQPSLLGSVPITSMLLYQLSSHELGRTALNTMLIHDPHCLDDYLNQITSPYTDECWFSQLLESHLGASILSTLYMINKNLLGCINLEVLEKKSSHCEDHQIPIYFWLASTIVGQRLLLTLFKRHPQLPKAISEETLTLSIKHQDVIYNDTNTLFWLTEEIKLLIDACNTINPELLFNLLNHPLYGKNILEPENSSDKRHFSEKGVLISGCFMPVSYSCSTLGSHAAWTLQEMDLIHAVLNAVKKNELTPLSKLLCNLLEQKKASSLLFDYTDANMNSVFLALLKNTRIMAWFKIHLKNHPRYYSLFTLGRLNQIIEINEVTSLSVIQLLIKNEPDLLDSLIDNQESLKNALTADLLLNSYTLFVNIPDRTNLLAAFVQDTKASVLKRLNQSLLLTPAFIAELFKIRSRKINDQPKNSDSFDFALLSIHTPELIVDWINAEPRLLNYFTKEHLVTKHYLMTEQPRPEYFYFLTRFSEGIDLLNSLLEKNPTLFNGLTIEQLTSTTKNNNSSCYNLSRGIKGCATLVKILRYQPELAASILPTHLMEKYTFLTNPSTKNVARKSIFESLCDYDKNHEVLEIVFANPSFMKEFKPEILFANLSYLLYGLCSHKKGIAILSSIIKHHPKVALNFSKELLFKTTASLPNNYSIMFSLLFLNAKEGLTIMKSLFKTNPTLIGLSALQLEQLSAQALSQKILDFSKKYAAKETQRYWHALEQALQLGEEVLAKETDKELGDDVLLDKEDIESASYSINIGMS